MKGFIILLALFGFAESAKSCSVALTPTYYQSIKTELEKRVPSYPRFKKYSIADVNPYALTIVLHRKERKCKKLYFRRVERFGAKCEFDYILKSIESCIRDNSKES